MHPILRTAVLFLVVCVTARAQEPTLHDAARDGDIATLRRLLAAGIDPNVEGEGGWTPLMYAVMGGNVAATRELLEGGADPNFGEAEQGPPLAAAAMTPVSPGRDENEILKLMIARGARVEILNGAGMTPLMYAAREGNVERVAYLIQQGANVNHRDGRGWTPIRFAASSGSATLVRLLLAHGALPNVLDESYRAPLHYAVITRNAEIAAALLDAAGDPNFSRAQIGYPSALQLAASQNDAAMVSLLCARGANPNYSDRGGLGDDGVARTPLDWARRNGNSSAEKALKSVGALTHKELTTAYDELFTATRAGKLKTVTRILAKGIDPRVPLRIDEENETALFDDAAAAGNAAIVRALIDSHVDFDDATLLSAHRVAQDRKHDAIASMILQAYPEKLARVAIYENDSPLLLAALAVRPEIATARDESGRTPLHHAAEQGSADMVVMLLERGADIGAHDSWKETPFFGAVRSGDTAVVATLLAARSDLATRNLRGMTPLHAAARAGRAAVVSMLISAGADVDATDDDGWSPLHHAVWANNSATIEALLAGSARRDLRDRRHRAPIDLARQMHKTEAAEALRD